jgi:tellurite resistance protein TerC
VWPETIRQARRLVVSVVGLTLLLCGTVMLVTPGPGVLVILAGLGVLALEFAWARRLLKKIKASVGKPGRTESDLREK